MSPGLFCLTEHSLISLFGLCWVYGVEGVGLASWLVRIISLRGQRPERDRSMLIATAG